MREQTLPLCEWMVQADVTPQASSIEGLRQMVSLGMGCTFLPKLATIEPFARVAPIEVRPLRPPKPTRILTLVWRRTHPRAAELRRLAVVLREGLAAGLASARTITPPGPGRRRGRPARR